MAFTPMNDKEIAEASLLPKGSIYDAVIVDSVTLGQNEIELEARESSNGNPMIVAPVEIYNEEGNKIQTIIDYIVFTPKMMFKVKHLCEAANLMDAYNSGDESAIVSKLAGKSVKVRIGIQKGNAEYPNDKNNIMDYVATATSKDLQKNSKSVAEELDDEIPF